MIQPSNGSPTTLSPRDLAQAIGVSESSVKRWVDAGRLPARRTSGGHRRIELLTALRFLRESDQRVVEPELLGLAASDPALGPSVGERLHEVLLDGDEREAIRLAMTAHVVLGMPVARLLDGPLREALDGLGEFWRGLGDGHFQERRAIQIVLRILERLGTIYEPRADSPVAVGGALEGDSSLAHTRMIATVLAAEKMHAVNLGSDTPAPVLLEAVERTGARLVWISASRTFDPEEQGAVVRQLARVLRNRQARLIVAGSACHELGLEADEVLYLGDRLPELADRVRALRSSAIGGSNPPLNAAS